MSFNGVLWLQRPSHLAGFRRACLNRSWERPVWPWLWTARVSGWTRRPGSDPQRYHRTCLPLCPLAKQPTFTTPLFHYHPFALPLGLPGTHTSFFLSWKALLFSYLFAFSQMWKRNNCMYAHTQNFCFWLFTQTVSVLHIHKCDQLNAGVFLASSHLHVSSYATRTNLWFLKF